MSLITQDASVNPVTVYRKAPFRPRTLSGAVTKASAKTALANYTAVAAATNPYRRIFPKTGTHELVTTLASLEPETRRQDKSTELSRQQGLLAGFDASPAYELMGTEFTEALPSYIRDNNLSALALAMYATSPGRVQKMVSETFAAEEVLRYIGSDSAGVAALRKEYPNDLWAVLALRMITRFGHSGGIGALLAASTDRVAVCRLDEALLGRGTTDDKSTVNSFERISKVISVDSTDVVDRILLKNIIQANPAYAITGEFTVDASMASFSSQIAFLELLRVWDEFVAKVNDLGANVTTAPARLEERQAALIEVAQLCYFIGIQGYLTAVHAIAQFLEHPLVKAAINRNPIQLYDHPLYAKFREALNTAAVGPVGQSILNAISYGDVTLDEGTVPVLVLNEFTRDLMGFDVMLEAPTRLNAVADRTRAYQRVTPDLDIMTFSNSTLFNQLLTLFADVVSLTEDMYTRPAFIAGGALLGARVPTPSSDKLDLSGYSVAVTDGWLSTEKMTMKRATAPFVLNLGTLWAGHTSKRLYTYNNDDDVRNTVSLIEGTSQTTSLRVGDLTTLSKSVVENMLKRGRAPIEGCSTPYFVVPHSVDTYAMGNRVYRPAGGAAPHILFNSEVDAAVRPFSGFNAFALDFGFEPDVLVQLLTNGVTNPTGTVAEVSDIVQFFLWPARVERLRALLGDSAETVLNRMTKITDAEELDGWYFAGTGYYRSSRTAAIEVGSLVKLGKVVSDDVTVLAMAQGAYTKTRALVYSVIQARPLYRYSTPSDMTQVTSIGDEVAADFRVSLQNAFPPVS